MQAIQLDKVIKVELPVWLPGSQGEKENVMNFMVYSFFFKGKEVSVFQKEKDFFWHTGLKYISSMDLPVRNVE